MLALLLLGGCAVGGDGGSPSPGSASGPSTTTLEAKRELAARPASPAATTTTTTTTTTTAAAAGAAAAPASTMRMYMDDAVGDAGRGAPAAADLRSVDIVDEGDHVRVTVVLAGPIPSRLARGEVMGVGVDLYRGEGPESDWQLFADGGEDGWYAYLDGPDGLVRYPGSFALDGAQMVFRVRWADVGDLRTGRAAAFVDWSGPKVTAADRAPDEGARPY